MQAFRGGRPGAAQTRIIIALTQPQSQSGGRDARPGWFFLTRVYRRTAPPSMRRPSGTGRCCGTPSGCDVHIHRSGAQIGTNYASVCLPRCLMTILTLVAQWRAYFEIRKRRDGLFPRNFLAFGSAHCHEPDLDLDQGRRSLVHSHVSPSFPPSFRVEGNIRHAPLARPIC